MGGLAKGGPVSSVKAVYQLRNTNPGWVNDLIAAIEMVPDSIFFDEQNRPLKREVEEFDRQIYNELCRRFQGLGRMERNLRLWQPEGQFEIDIVLPTSPRTLIEIEKGQLPRLELDIIKIMSAVFLRPEEYAYGCLVIPANYIELKLARGQTSYQYVTEHLLRLARPLFDNSNSARGYVLREFCVVGYWDPRGGEDTRGKGLL